MKQIRDKVVGLDVHRYTVVACCRVPGGRGFKTVRRSFTTTAKALSELSSWLLEAGVTTVVMEATGVYWKPVYYALEGLFEELWLCNALHRSSQAGARRRRCRQHPSLTHSASD
jgi:transposase